MTDYTKTTDFTSKDSLPSGDSGKIIRGAEFGTEFDNIETAVNSKSNIENPSFTGNITVTGTVDGRDIAADGTKLDTIETSADVTDTANVTAAGAVMDSELTDITAVKALNQGVATTDSPTFAAVTSTGNVTVGGTVDGRDVAADGTKLDTVETNADVTDTTNVTAAGALMDSEVTNLDQVKAFDSADYATAAQGTTADNALPKTGGAMTGAITTNSTFDGRDVATDGTKLDGIEAGATADQTPAQIKTAYESNANTNAFTDADHTKLDGIEASADVTDTTNVTAAGAVMDSELTDIAAVKALNQGVATTDSPTFAGATVNGTVEFDGLSGTGAVTVTDILDQDNMSSNSATALATQQSIKSYVDSQVATSDTLAEVLANGNATGGTDVAFGDNDKAIFGAGSDLQIYHDGSASYISDVGTGNLRIKSNGVATQILDGSSLNLAVFNSGNGQAQLYNVNSGTSTIRLATTSTGIDVSGTVSADGLTVTSGSSSDSIMQVFGGGTIYAGLGVDGTGAILTAGSTGSADSDLIIKTSSSGTEVQRARFQDNGDISFYEDTGTTAKFFWDAADESLGLGTNTPSQDLEILNGTTGAGIRLAATDTAYWDIERDSTSGDLTFTDDGAGTVLTVGQDGNVGIGTDSPQGPLQVALNSSRNLVVGFDTEGDSRLSLRSIEDTANKLRPIQIEGQEIVLGTAAFDQTVSSEAMRIDSSGNLLVGTTTTNIATEGTVIYGAGNEGVMQLSSTAMTALYINRSNDGELVQLRKNNATVGSIGTNSGFVRIGTSDTNLLMHSAIDTIVPHSGSANRDAAISLGYSGARFKDLYLSGGLRGDTTFKNNAGTTEYARFDSSGNLLVGTTSVSNAGKVTIDAGANASGLYAVTDASSGYAAAVFERSASDGDIAVFKQGGTTVGSIGVASNDLNINGGANHSGIRFQATGLYPLENGTASSGEIDLGAAGSKFKNLYLSGGVYLGGTAAVNKLDDYEEGTFTPVMTGVSGWSGSSGVTGYYTKIGNTVHVFITMTSNVALTGTAGSTITGLPFANNVPERTSSVSVSRMFGIGLTTTDYIAGVSGTEILFGYVNGDNNSNNFTHSGSTLRFTLTATYRTA